MSGKASDYRERATQTLNTAKTLHSVDPNAAASRAFYSGFYAVTALFLQAAHKENAGQFPMP